MAPQGTLSSRGPSPPEDPLSPDGDSPCLAAQFTLSRLAAIHLVPQGTLSSRGPSLAAQFTLSRLAAIHLVPQGTLSRLAAIHLVRTAHPTHIGIPECHDIVNNGNSSVTFTSFVVINADLG